MCGYRKGLERNSGLEYGKKTCSEDSENDEERQQRLYSKLKIKSVCLEAFIDE